MICNFCGLRIPETNIDGTPSEDGREYIQKGIIVWHLAHPLYDNCWDKEVRGVRLDLISVSFEEIKAEQYDDIEPLITKFYEVLNQEEI